MQIHLGGLSMGESVRWHRNQVLVRIIVMRSAENISALVDDGIFYAVINTVIIAVRTGIKGKIVPIK